MKKSLFKIAALGLASVVMFASCKKDDAPVDNTPAPTDQTFTQSFESMTDATNQGWVFRNLSDDTGDPWVIRSTTLFYNKAPFDGSKLLYSNYEASYDVVGNISNWAISPKLYFQNGDKISFYAMSSGTIDGYGDRVQLRLNTFNTSDSIGEASTDLGGFTKPLVDINSSYSTTAATGFPTTWTKYEATIVGLNKPDSGRFAIRYFVELDGGNNGDEIAIDKVQFTSKGH